MRNLLFLEFYLYELVGTHPNDYHEDGNEIWLQEIDFK
jgi:hypothetical protein